MYGTEKQIKYAEDLIASEIESLEEIISTFKNHLTCGNIFLQVGALEVIEEAEEVIQILNGFFGDAADIIDAFKAKNTISWIEGRNMLEGRLKRGLDPIPEHEAYKKFMKFYGIKF